MDCRNNRAKKQSNQYKTPGQSKAPVFQSHGPHSLLWLKNGLRYRASEHTPCAWSFAHRTWLCPSCGSGTLELPGLPSLKMRAGVNSRLRARRKMRWRNKLNPLLSHLLSLYVDPSYNLLRSWILRKMKKMRTAMRTTTIPAPMTIPIIWRKEAGGHGESHCSKDINVYVLFLDNALALTHVTG